MAIGRRAMLQQRRAHAGDLRAQRHVERRRAGFGLREPGARARLFRLGGVEHRQRHVDGHDAADVAAAKGGPLGAGDEFGLGHQTTAGGALAEPRRLDLLLAGRHFAAHRAGTQQQLVEPWHRHRARNRSRRGGGQAGRVAGLGQEAAEVGLRAGTRDASRRQRFLDSDHLALGTQAVVPGGVAGTLTLRNQPGDLGQSIASGGPHRFLALRQDEIGISQSQSGTNRAHFLVAAADAGVHERGRGIGFELAPPGDRERLRDQQHVLGHAGHRLAVERHDRVRPARGRPHVGAGDVGRGTDGANARTVRRELRDRVGFRENGLTRGRRARRQQRQSHARCACPHTTP